MILKYKVPLPYRNMFNNEKVIYCSVLKHTDAVGKRIYLVRMLNFLNITNVFEANELQKINIIDKIKLNLIKRRKR